MAEMRQSKVGFAIVKIDFGGTPFFLMRKNDKWNDFNFIGGHEDPRDNGSLLRAAQREFREEVPTGRGMSFALSQITDEFRHGPMYSKSAGAAVVYKVQFFLVRIGSDPSDLIMGISKKSKNRFVPQRELIVPSSAITGFAEVLGHHVMGGLQAIPLSWEKQLPSISEYAGRGDSQQLDLKL